MRSRRWLTLAALALVAGAGCSRGGGGSLATVSGVVKFNGAPADGVKVTFHSTVEGGGQQAGAYSALTDSEGKYLIASVGKEPGIPAGMYKVTITKYDVKAGNLPPDYDIGQVEAAGLGTNALPKDYETLATTKLSVTLESGKNENKDFNLKGKPSKSKAAGAPGSGARRPVSARAPGSAPCPSRPAAARR